MSVKEDLEQALKTNIFWHFVTRHGYEHYSKETGEKIPEEVFTNKNFVKYVELYKDLLNINAGIDQHFLKHGDGNENFSAVNGAHLTPEINRLLKYHHQLTQEKENKIQGYYIRKSRRKPKISNSEWGKVEKILQKYYTQEIEMGLPFKIRRKDFGEDSPYHLKHSFVYINRKLYQIQEMIGKGQQGKVKRILDKEGNAYVVKVEVFNETVKDELDAEIAALNKMGMFIGNFERDYTGTKQIDGKKRYLLMPLIEGTQLDKFLKSREISELEKLKICQNIVKGLMALHEQRIIVSDIKTDNIMINPDTLEVTFIDFGKSIILPHGVNQMINPYIKGWYNRDNPYIPPETNKDGTVSVDSDIWLLGYRIMSHHMNFKDTNIRKYIQNNIMNQEPDKRSSLLEISAFLNEKIKLKKLDRKSKPRNM